MVILSPRAWPRRTRLLLLVAICLTAAVAVIRVPRVPLGSSYHVFADKRELLGIPNAGDVLSNLPFFLVGMWALIWLSLPSSRSAFLDRRERIPYLVFFAGVMLTGVGSFWYHLAPSDSRLPWDLLPMTCSFIALIVATYMERVNLPRGFLALIPMLLAGSSTVAYWYFSTDYKYYLFLQFFSPVVLALLIGLFPPRYSGVRYLVIAFGFYVAAKLFETYDFAIYQHLGQVVSGHSLKHVTAALACIWILEMLRRRQAIPAPPARSHWHLSYVKKDTETAAAQTITRRFE